jgi:hypothetical protein
VSGPDKVNYVAYVVMLLVIALVSLDTATTGKLSLWRNSDRGWNVSKRARLLCVLIGTVAALVGIIVFHYA